MERVRQQLAYVNSRTWPSKARRWMNSLMVCTCLRNDNFFEEKEIEDLHLDFRAKNGTKINSKPLKEEERRVFPGRNDDAMDLLNSWLDELDAAKMKLQDSEQFVRKHTRERRKWKDESKRSSIIEPDSINDEELLEILADLTLLECELEEEIQSEKYRRDVIESELKDESDPLITSTIDEIEERIRTENMRIAMEKIKEASIKKLFVKVFTSDGSSKSLLVDENMTVGQITKTLTEKNLVSLGPLWAIVELAPELGIERVYEDHELLVENCLLWKADTRNTLWFMERPEKFDVFQRPEEYFSIQGGDFSKEELFDYYFCGSKPMIPSVEGTIWVKVGRQRKWSKHFCVLRSDGIYYLPKKKMSSEMECLATFAVNDVYYGVNWKERFKAPTDCCFGIKHPKIQASNSKNMKHFCVETEMDLHRWVTAIRLAKHGQQLCDNYQEILENMVPLGIPSIMNREFSPVVLNFAANPQDDGSTVQTPSSENKSFDSAFSSGPGSEVSQSGHYKSTRTIEANKETYSSTSSGNSSISDAISVLHLDSNNFAYDETFPLPSPPITESTTSLIAPEYFPSPPGSIIQQNEKTRGECFCQLETSDEDYSLLCDNLFSNKKITFNDNVQVIFRESDCSDDKDTFSDYDISDMVSRKVNTFKTFFDDVWFTEQSLDPNDDFQERNR